ncbi:MAG: GNAT family N-acetyltransferase [Lachnospiraceae bacterium]|nr:GNAT family N-acetyltransferase [Lachnospiraceae bacterium]
MIRRATTEDASRLAEILVFTKRMNYRRIFQNDKVSFGEIQVYPIAKTYIENPDKLEGIWVYDDEFVKGLVHIAGEKIEELYVEHFFENCGIGGELMRFAIERGCRYLWVLEKNEDARRFYGRYGFAVTGKKEFQEGTTEYIIEMKRE